MLVPQGNLSVQEILFLKLTRAFHTLVSSAMRSFLLWQVHYSPMTVSHKILLDTAVQILSTSYCSSLLLINMMCAFVRKA